MPRTLQCAHAVVRADQSTEELTVDELGRIVGMSPRNIRAHQARRLLSPPARRGRVVRYDDSHVRRLRTIVALQRQGFNLVSIEAILGVREATPDGPTLAPALDQLAAEAPALLHALVRHRVVARTEDGAWHSARPQVTRAALKLHHLGVAPAKTLQVLGEILERLGPVTEELIRTSRTRVLAQFPDPAASSLTDPDVDPVALTQGIVELLAEAFRVAVDNCAEDLVAELVNQRHGRDVGATRTIDNG